MKDRAVLIALGSGTGAFLCLLLLVKSTVGRPTIPNQSPPSLQSLEVQPIPLPPPPSISPHAFQDGLTREFNQQQALTDNLQKELDAQKALADDLKRQLERQERDTEEVLKQLQTYQTSVERITTQQEQLIASIPRHNETQTMLLWGVLGLFMLLMVGGGLAFAILALWILQIQRQNYHRPTMVYPARIPPDPHFYYDKRPLPSSEPRQQFVQYDVRPYED
jgi:hypothetical protein